MNTKIKANDANNICENEACEDREPYGEKFCNLAGDEATCYSYNEGCYSSCPMNTKIKANDTNNICESKVCEDLVFQNELNNVKSYNYNYYNTHPSNIFKYIKKKNY
jgi:hypothetical protein